MVTKRMVQPAYTSIKLMDILNYIPLSLDLKTGKLIYEGRLITRFIHNVVLYVSVLKVVHVSYALARLLMDFKMESLHVVILTALWLSLMGTSTYWARELFHRGLQETILLFNSSSEPPNRLNDQVFNRRSMKDWKNGSAWVKTVVRLLLSFNLQELMCVATPFVVKLFAPLYVVMMAVFPHWTIFATSLIHTYEGGWWKLGLGLIVILETLTAFYMESNILFLFFFQLALQVTHFGRIKTIIDGMR